MQELTELQKRIVCGILSEEFNEDNNNKKYEALGIILTSKQYLFLPSLINILKKAKAEVDIYRNDGCYSCWILENSFFESLSDDEKALIIDTLSTGAIPGDTILTYLHMLEKKYHMKKILA